MSNVLYFQIYVWVDQQMQSIIKVLGNETHTKGFQIKVQNSQHTKPLLAVFDSWKYPEQRAWAQVVHCCSVVYSLCELIFLTKKCSLSLSTFAGKHDKTL